ncbi:hypothetical protein CsatB_018964 [Cannabis sativa]
MEDTDQEMEFQLFVETYQLPELLIKERDAIYESLTYSSKLYVSAGLIWKTSRDMQEQTIFIVNIPLMNSLGTSIVNGIYRIVINQILQNPSIDYRSKLDHNRISVYTGTIISDWGGRLELEIDRKARIWARVSRKQKISIIVLSSAMGSNLREILENISYPEIFLSFLNDKEKKKLSGDPVFSESLCKELQKKFFQQRCELGRIGRRNMNRRLNLDIPQNNTFLLPRDILAVVDHLIGMKFGMGILDDMNHLKNKRIRSVANLLQDQFGLALVHLENIVRGTMSGAIRDKLIPTPQNFVTSTTLTTTFESFFGLHPLSQVLDQTNPVTQIVHGRKLSYMGPGGLTGRTASFRIRDIHPSHYGHICPIDTSEGINVGLIGSLSIHARIGPWGSLESLFYEISERSKKVRMLYLSPSRNEYYMVAGGNSLALNRGSREEQVVPARYRQEFLTIEWEQILADGAATVGSKLSLGKKCISSLYAMGGYNFEDAVLINERLVYGHIYTSFHIRKYEIQTHVRSHGPERITNEIAHLEAHLLRNLDKKGVVMLGSWVETSDILLGKLTPQMAKESLYASEDRLLRAILGIQISTSKETCLKLPIGSRGRVIDVRWIQKKGDSSYNLETIRVYISQKHEIKVGDKVAGRHGNKGIVSKILPIQDMPYFQDGRPVDMVFNPLGVPSQMNVGQIFECSLGLAGELQDRHYRIAPFDERYEQEASRKPVSRQNGHYALVTQQPLRGRAKQRGQRVGEMEVWALEGFGVAHILQEMLTYKSDHIRARQEVLCTTIIGGPIRKPEEGPESFRLLNFSSMIDRYKHQQLQIGSVSPQQISAWAKKILPNGEIIGEVTKPYTFHYKTNKPEKDGLFCGRIFGPIKSGICACGNYRVIGNDKEDPKFCEQYGVEFVDSQIQRYQMGYIKFACLVTHVWYLKRIPSYIANLLDKPLKELEGLVYCDVGEGAIREQLVDLDLGIIIDYSLAEWKELGEEGPTGNEWEDQKVGRRKDFLVRRIKLAKHFIRTNIVPEWMVLCLLLVLPPELRPIIQIDSGKLMSSDINELYRRVIYRNNTLIDFLTTSRSTPGELVMCQEKLVQEAVDTLLDNGIRGQPMRDGHNKVYKSFSDVIEGKEGKFRETLLGKRVDYSGRSVIVVGPSLSLHRCGLPRKIAIELFQTFVIRSLIRKHFSSNIGVAKSKIREKEPVVWEILQEVMQGHPVLLNRAPTLHRLGIQAFQSILVEGHAIFLHPLVCKGFNADFDGDQMAVNVPLSLEAQAEARLLMFSHTKLLSPAIGDPISVPTQDMLIGLYVLTSSNRRGICANRYNPSNHRNYQNERIGDNTYKYIKEPFFGNSYAKYFYAYFFRLIYSILYSRKMIYTS